MLINSIVDNILIDVKNFILQQGKDTLLVEDLRHDWKYRWHFLKLKGSVRCTNGKLKNLSSIRRTGDSFFKIDGNSMGVSFALGLEQLSLSYKCKIKAKNIINLTQKIKVTVNYDSVRGEISLTRSGDSCLADLKRLEIDRLDGVRIHSGGGPIHKVEDRLLNGFYKHCHGSLLKNTH